MAVTIALVEQEHNHLRYLWTWDGVIGTGTSGNITSTGAASPDLQTDSLSGPIKQCSLVVANGLGALIAAGAQTQATARAIWMADSADTVLGNKNVPRCKTKITVRTFAGQVGLQAGVASPQVLADANVDGSGNPIISVSTNATLGGNAASAYVDVQYFEGPIASDN
jgi:hypothetical protein